MALKSSKGRDFRWATVNEQRKEKRKKKNLRKEKRKGEKT